MLPQVLRHRWIVTCMACCLAVAAGRGAAAPARETPKASDKAAAADAQKQMMEAMMKAAQPGPQHEMMKKCEGSWKAVVKSWMGPGDPMISEGSAQFKMILGDRYLEQRFNGTFQDKPFEGYGLTGYDNMQKTYTMLWIDNSSTGMMHGTGSYDDAKKTLTFRATSPGPDGKPMTMRRINVMPDDSTQVFKMYGVEKGKETKMMEITYTRM